MQFFMFRREINRRSRKTCNFSALSDVQVQVTRSGRGHVAADQDHANDWLLFAGLS